jgi:hypothetical protein
MSETTDHDPLQDLLDLDLEYRLTVAFRLIGGCNECAQYLIERREVLMPEIMIRANEKGEHPVDMFDKFQRGVHARHSDG